MQNTQWLLRWLVLIPVVFSLAPLEAQTERIPHAQDKPPGPPLSPAEAIRKMTVPDGFSVELVASEPEIVNPVAMTIDERGRFWITESLEYPRRSPGPGQDRVKILEDTDSDGRADRFTVFMEGLNIPSGIAVGHGGVWIANAPDILFVQDTDHDGKADTQEVVVTGFGRDDTHELPNSLTWGPDGWLYGLNGVFNASHVRYGPGNPNFREDHEGWKFTCAMFRIHPKTREFQLFCEGTSNPWGIAFDNEGEAFVSACVIDHLWHLTETGYYHRQGGPYPPFTWKIESIVGHKHQKAAYCGIHWYDSDAYPEQYRKKLYMGNIHGGCINCDRIERRDPTYHAAPEPDLLTANDAWFMPVVQKTGPDGCLYILDWYDRYHCYQDANRDPAGIDRLKGRLYRIRYQNSPRAKPENLTSASDAVLISRLASPNGYQREIAQRLLTERLLSGNSPNELRAALEATVLQAPADAATLRAFGVLMAEPMLSTQLLRTLLRSESELMRAWAARAASNQQSLPNDLAQQVLELRTDSSPRVRLQAVICAARHPQIGILPLLISVLAQSGDDPLTPRIVWQHLHPLLETRTEEFVSEIQALDRNAGSWPQPVVEILPRAADRILSSAKPDTKAVAQLVSILSEHPATAEPADRCFQLLTSRIRSGEISGLSAEELRQQLSATLEVVLQATPETPAPVSAVELATSLKLKSGLSAATKMVTGATDENTRLSIIHALITAGDPLGLTQAESLLASSTNPETRRRAVQAIGRVGSPEATEALLNHLHQLPEEVQPAVIEALTDREASAIELLAQIRDQKTPATLINANQARKMLSLRNEALTGMVLKHWGAVKTERDPTRTELISRMRNDLRSASGDPVSGRLVFRKLCGQCHKIYGEGAEVGPDITRNGRASFEQLLSNVFDPSLVIGASYQALTVVTKNGKAVSGLPIEVSDQRVALRVQGDKQETFPRTEIEEVVQSQLSLMPEGLEKQLSPKDLHDLFAFITLDKPPEDQQARLLPGTKIIPAETSDPAEFRDLVEQLLSGYSVSGSGEGGVAVLSDYHGRPALRTHPESRSAACRLSTSTTLPVSPRIRLRIGVAPHDQGDWELVVLVNGEKRHQSIVRRNRNAVEWKDIFVDLSDHAGKPVTIDLLNQANDWSWEYAFWNSAELLVD